MKGRISCGKCFGEKPGRWVACNGIMHGPNVLMENPPSPHNKSYEVSFFLFSGRGWEVSMGCLGSSQSSLLLLLGWSSTSVASLTMQSINWMCWREGLLSRLVICLPLVLACFLLGPLTLKLEAPRASQPSVNLYQTKQRHIPDLVLLIVTAVETSNTSYNSICLYDSLKVMPQGASECQLAQL